MSDAAILADSISKRYRIGVKEQMHDTFGGAVLDLISRPVRNLRRLRKLSHFATDGQEADDVIWALKDVSFEVKRGEVVGIIGANGSGKTTLLKILSNITEPTSGFADVRGRVSSLLEVGTGFHPELTGRENIYLNGTILGMNRKEVQRKFDEIVDFSGVEKFIDTPVKRFSSGMKVRLAFSVAAHLEPEILLVDEVLSVGDAAFQRKSLGKMGDVSEEGLTILFVSHNMGAIRRLCPSSILLRNGGIALRGPSNEVVNRYLSNSATAVLSRGDGGGTVDHVYPADPLKPMQIRRLRILDPDGEPAPQFDNRFAFTIEIEFEVREPTSGAYLGWVLYTLEDAIVCGSQDHDTAPDRTTGRQPGLYVARVEFPGNILNSGTYRLGAYISAHTGAVDRQDLTLEIIDGQSFGRKLGGQRNGVLLMPLSWQVESRNVERGLLRSG